MYLHNYLWLIACTCCNTGFAGPPPYERCITIHPSGIYEVAVLGHPASPPSLITIPCFITSLLQLQRLMRAVQDLHICPALHERALYADLMGTKRNGTIYGHGSVALDDDSTDGAAAVAYLERFHFRSFLSSPVDWTVRPVPVVHDNTHVSGCHMLVAAAERCTACTTYAHNSLDRLRRRHDKGTGSDDAGAGQRRIDVSRASHQVLTMNVGRGTFLCCLLQVVDLRLEGLGLNSLAKPVILMWACATTVAVKFALHAFQQWLTVHNNDP